MENIGLNPNLKTIMYAPTWGWGYGNDTFFARWFGQEKKVFEQLCKEVKKNNLNFIVKLHCLSFQTNNKELIDIANRYDVLWLTKETDRFMEDPNSYLWITDILISDLSGIIADFLVLDRPIIYIDPDESLDAWGGAENPQKFKGGGGFEKLLTPKKYRRGLHNIFFHTYTKSTT